MNLPRVFQRCVVVGVVGLACSAGLNRLYAAQPDPISEEGVEVLTRGPVHEAFAETVSFDPEPGLLVPNAPPEPIEELPPDQKLEGDNVAWIPGYWAWDDERSDYLWVSGVWRALPPGRQWISGYWADYDQEFQWTSGYWADAEMMEVEYLPEPPQSLEVGPNIDAPSADHTWLPGCWIWQDFRYAWRPGYWATVEPDWVWIPAYYVWTPGGYVFVDGYWDYSIDRRGLLFAPVYFSGNVYSRPGFYYSPATVINPAVFGMHLFLRPQYGHYYFGDYYGANYATAGFSPWFAFHNRQGYDPIYAHDRWRNRGDRGWEQQVQVNFRNFRDREDMRPPRTWMAQRDRAGRTDPSGGRSFAIASALDVLARSSDSPLRLQAVDNDERERIGARGQEIRRFRAERREREFRAAATPVDRRPGQSRPARVRIPRSPIVARTARELGEGQAPPVTQQGPDADPTVRPEPRGRTGRRPDRPLAGDAPGEESPSETPRTGRPGRRPDGSQAGAPTDGDTPPAETPRATRPGQRPDRPQPGAPDVGESPQPEVPRARQPGRRPDRPQAGAPTDGDMPPAETPRATRPGQRPDRPQPGAPEVGESPRLEVPRARQPGRRPDRPQAGAPTDGGTPPAETPRATRPGQRPDRPQPGAPEVGESPRPEIPRARQPGRRPERPQAEAPAAGGQPPQNDRDARRSARRPERPQAEAPAAGGQPPPAEERKREAKERKPEKPQSGPPASGEEPASEEEKSKRKGRKG